MAFFSTRSGDVGTLGGLAPRVFVDHVIGMHAGSLGLCPFDHRRQRSIKK